MAVEPTTFVSRVFWPVPCADAPAGWLVGWNVRNFITCVACVVPAQRASLAELETVLSE